MYYFLTDNIYFLNMIRVIYYFITINLFLIENFQMFIFSVNFPFSFI